jgi:hypothetical protein
MDFYSVLLFAHVICVIYWMGASLGVLTLALALKKSTYTYEQRQMLIRLSLDIDIPPRIAMVIIAPIGLHLASTSGLLSISTPVLVLVWIGAAGWLGGEYITHGREHEPFAVKVYITIGVIMAAAFLSLIGYGIYSLINGWPFNQNWLALKALLLGLVFLVSIWMARYYAPLVNVVERLKTEGSTAEIEAEIRFYVNRGAMGSAALFCLLASIVYLGVNKPF